MQNAAHAYLQTQVGTTGQGEIVVMLFDGALRFLAQAREKMEAKDYAAKGLLISRALDIINELDSSLNQDVGGELAKNLHQLYFLCTTRLLQANMKLDMAKLDSVVEILTGLRGAFAQILVKPEVQAVCAQLGAKLNAQTTASVPRAITTQGRATAPRAAAAGLYNQQDNLPRSPAEPAPPSPPAFAPGLGVPFPPLSGQGAAPVPATAPQEIRSAASSAPQADAPASPAAEAAEELLPKASSGFAGKRLSLYGKMLHTR